MSMSNVDKQIKRYYDSLTPEEQAQNVAWGNFAALQQATTLELVMAAHREAQGWADHFKGNGYSKGTALAIRDYLTEVINRMRAGLPGKGE